MATSSSPFFGKRDRENDALTSRPAPLVGSGTNLSGSPVNPSSLTAQAGLNAASAAAPAAKEGGSKLTVGPNIKLKGVEITDCDTLVVEGLVEATMDSRLMQIAEQGEFKGSAEIDIAEIRGVFDGNLTGAREARDPFDRQGHGQDPLRQDRDRGRRPDLGRDQLRREARGASRGLIRLSSKPLRSSLSWPPCQPPSSRQPAASAFWASSVPLPVLPPAPAVPSPGA